jgi:hypothetical protein
LPLSISPKKDFRAPGGQLEIKHESIGKTKEPPSHLTPPKVRGFVGGVVVNEG